MMMLAWNRSRCVHFSLNISHRALHGMPNHNATIRELMKILHPDLFAMDASHVQADNIECIQNMQEITGFLHDISTQWKQSPQTEILIKSPLRDSYDLKCFFKDENKEISPISVIVKPSASLCQRVVTTQQHIQTPIVQLIEQISQLWINLKIDNPWSEILQKYQVTQKKILPMENEMISSGIIGEISASIFDNTVARKHRSHQSSSPIFSTIQSSNKQHSKKTNRKHLSKLVDRYLMSGNVRFQNVHAVNESDVLLNFRVFLLHYGDLVNFNENSWSKIFIVLNNSNNGAVSYNVSKQKDGYYIVNIPVKFATEELLEVLQSEVPMCELF